MIRDGQIQADVLRMVALDDVGLPGYAAAVGITADGEEILTLAHRASCGTDVPVQRDWAEVAPHECVGKLPARWARERGLMMCGRKTRKATLCRNIVRNPGDACMRHAAGACG